jgi:hypothetical protein
MGLIGEARATAIIHAPIEYVNLAEWMFSITSEEYAACAVGHQSAAQGRLASGKRFSVNIELVAGMLMVQHYIEKVSERRHVVGFSPNTVFWLSDAQYVLAEVTWELKVERLDASSCELTCMALSESYDEPFVTKLHEALRDMPAEHSPLQQHIEEEAPMFARDIERKALARIWL